MFNSLLLPHHVSFVTPSKWVVLLPSPGVGWRRTRFHKDYENKFPGLPYDGSRRSQWTRPFLNGSNYILSSYIRLRPFSATLLNPILLIRHVILHHHHVAPLARKFVTLSRHFSQSFIASGRSLRLHAVSSHCCCMYVRAGRPAFAWLYVGVHRSTSLMSSSLLLQQCSVILK